MPTRTITTEIFNRESGRPGVGIDAQRVKVTAYAQLYDLELVDVIVDAGESAPDRVLADDRSAAPE